MFGRIGTYPVGRGNRVLVVVSFHEDRALLSLHLSGPNGSRAGTGTKGWPRILLPLFPRYDRRRDRWSSTLHVPLPHVAWRRGYQLRRLGGIRIHQASWGFWNGVAERAHRREIARRPVPHTTTI